MAARVSNFGTTIDGRRVDVADIGTGALRARILTFGATLQDLRLAGAPWPLTLGSDALAAYEGPLRYAGAVVGPVANRIAGATARIDGRVCTFEATEPRATLHGGATGTWSRIWTIAAHSDHHVDLTLSLPDGLGGFPGNRRLTARYQVDGRDLTLTLTGETDTPTLLSLAPHSYWNLDGRATTAGQTLKVAADRYTPTDDQTLPTGEIRSVAGTDFDLRAGRALEDVARYDINLCLADGDRPLTEVAWLRGTSGVGMALATTAPGLQVYDGAGLSSAPWPGLTGQVHGAFAGVALEPQLWPDATNHPAFPPHLLRPGETFRQVTRYRFTRGG